MAGEFNTVDKLFRSFITAFYAKGKHGTVAAVLEILFGVGMARMIFQPGITHPGDLVVIFQPAGQFQRIFCVPLDPQGECFKRLKKEKTVKGSYGRPQISQAFYASPCGQGDIAKRSVCTEDFPEVKSMISRSRLCKEGIAAVSIIEISRINNDSSDAVSMTADPLGCRVQYNIGSVLDRSRDGARSSECVVNDQSHTMLLCHS